MNYKTTTIATIGMIAVLVAGTLGFQYNEIIAQETEEKGHKFAEDTSITGVFKFRDGVELIPFEVFNQESGWDADDPVVFQMQKIVGDTPLLHQASDMARKFSRGNIPNDFNYKFFDIEVILAQEGKILRTFDYLDCRVTDYEVATDFDKEEGWMGKGFAVKDVFEFTCDGYTPKNQKYEVMHNQEKAHTTSSLDLAEPFYTWTDHFKATSGKN